MKLQTVATLKKRVCDRISVVLLLISSFKAFSGISHFAAFEAMFMYPENKCNYKVFTLLQSMIEKFNVLVKIFNFDLKVMVTCK